MSNSWFRTSLLAIVVSLNVTFIPPAQAEVPPDFDNFVNKALKDYNVPGVAVAIVDGDHVFTRGYGVRSVDKPGAVDADTIFMLASVSKAFTAALVGTLVDEHKVSWDGHVVDYYPDFMLHDYYATRMCTPRDLLAHRSGLPAFVGDNLEALGFDRAETLRRIRYLEPACSFREKAGYSNPGFLEVGAMAAHVAGTTYEDMVKERLFKPLSMTRSGVSVKDYTKDNVSDAHAPNPKGGSRVVPWDTSDVFAPAGSLTSTANDMARFVQMQLNDGTLNGRKIVSADAIREMHKPAMVDEPTFAEMPPIDAHSGFAFSLGWDNYHYKGHEIVEKAGARHGVRSVVTLIPDKKIGVVVLANQNLTAIPEAIRAYVLDKMVEPAGEDLQAKIKTADIAVQKVFGNSSVPKQTAAILLPLSNYTGEYENDLYGKIRVFEDQGKLRWMGGPLKVTGSLEPLAYNSFTLVWPPGRIALPEEVAFTLAPDGHPSSFRTESFGVLTAVGSKEQKASP